MIADQKLKDRLYKLLGVASDTEPVDEFDGFVDDEPMEEEIPDLEAEALNKRKERILSLIEPKFGKKSSEK